MSIKGATRSSRPAGRKRGAAAWLAAAGMLALTTMPALCLSELEAAPPAAEGPSDPAGRIERAPLRVPEGDDGPEQPLEAAPREAEPGAPARDVLRPDTEDGKPLPEVRYGLDALPEPVRRMHGLIVDAARTGELEALRPLIGTGDGATRLSFGGDAPDPLQFLREVSGDEEGQEILAILLEVLQAGYVHLDAGTASELYVWPYFFALPLDSLDKRQRVELFTLVTAGDYEDMRSFGAYIFYRVGITPSGEWLFFVAGD